MKFPSGGEVPSSQHDDAGSQISKPQTATDFSPKSITSTKIASLRYRRAVAAGAMERLAATPGLINLLMSRKK
jgi:hypothetical protein